MAEVTRRAGRSSRRSTARRSSASRARVTWDPVTAQKGGYKHFLLKEIHEQPQAIIDTMRGRILQEAGRRRSSTSSTSTRRWLEQTSSASTLVACGTAWHACLVGKFLIEQLARHPVRGRLRQRVPLPRSGPRPGHAADRGLAVGRDRRHARRGRGGARARRQGARDLQRRRLVDRAARRRRALHARRPRDQRREHQGVHHPAHRALPARRSTSGASAACIDAERGARSSIADLVNLPSPDRGVPRSASSTIEKRREEVRRAHATSSTSAAASTTRSRSRARSS